MSQMLLSMGGQLFELVPVAASSSRSGCGCLIAIVLMFMFCGRCVDCDADRPNGGSSYESSNPGVFYHGQELSYGSIVFEHGSDVLLDGSSAVLERLSILLNQNPGLVIEIGGHTDSSGDADINLSVSNSRANAVREALISRGVDPNQLEIRAYGESEPIADNSTDEGRAQNRRISFTVLRW